MAQIQQVLGLLAQAKQFLLPPVLVKLVLVLVAQVLGLLAQVLMVLKLMDQA